MSAGRVVWILLGAALLGGCAAPPPPSRTQLDATQVREIDAAPDRAFSAAANAIIDAGYTMDVSDGNGGLLSGHKLFEHSVARKVLVAILTRGEGQVPPDVHSVCVQVRDSGGGRSSVRLQTYFNGTVQLEKQTVDDLWVVMQREVLMREPLHSSGAPAAPTR